MRIIDDIKLDFEDVLIRPQRSATASRKEVDIIRTFKFRNSNQEWTGVPILAANMDTTGTFAMADTLDKYDMGTCLHKYYPIDTLCEFIKQRTDSHHFFTPWELERKTEKN